MMYPSAESAEAIASLTRPYGRREALDPATRPLPPYDCPTGTCRTDKVCEEVVEGDTIDSASREHVERNACNRCPSTNPTPVMQVVDRMWPLPDGEEVSHYEDSEGNQWLPDSIFTAPHYHGDAGIGARDAPNMTFRIHISAAGGRGYQCRYYGGVLDDTSIDLGTFDYADGGTTMHVNMDVSPHNANPNYAPNLTETY